MGLYDNPLAPAGYPPNVTGTAQTQPSEVRAATLTEANAGLLDSVYISPKTQSASVALDFANPPVTGYGSGTKRPVQATTITATTPIGVPSGGTGANTLTGLVTGTGVTAMVATAITQYNVITGGATNLPNSVAPSATVGVPLISQGAASQPVFGTAVVAGGGTGAVTLAQNGVLYGNATSPIGASAQLKAGQTVVAPTSTSAPTPTYFSNAYNTYIPSFNAIPLMSATTGGVAVVTQGSFNLWSFPQFGGYFETNNWSTLGIIAPLLSTTAAKGLNFESVIDANGKAFEITEGNSVNTKNAFVTGTSPAFFVKATFSIATLNTVQNLAIGFRKVQTYQHTSLVTYSDYALIGVLSTLGEFNIQTQIATGGEVDTDTTQAAVAATNFTLQVNVSTGGVVTYLINGSAPSVTAAYTFTAATTVIPMIYLANAAGAHGEVDLISYQCGLQ